MNYVCVSGYCIVVLNAFLTVTYNPKSGKKKKNTDLPVIFNFPLSKLMVEKPVNHPKEAWGGWCGGVGVGMGGGERTLRGGPEWAESLCPGHSHGALTLGSFLSVSWNK